MQIFIYLRKYYNFLVGPLDQNENENFLQFLQANLTQKMQDTITNRVLLLAVTYRDCEHIAKRAVQLMVTPNTRYLRILTFHSAIRTEILKSLSLTVKNLQSLLIAREIHIETYMKERSDDEILFLLIEKRCPYLKPIQIYDRVKIF